MTWTRAYKKIRIDRSFRVERQEDPIPADMLIPLSLVPFALALKGHSEWRDLVLFLLNRHRARVLRVAEQARNLRFRYQSAGLSLRRFCYIPYRDTIAELRILSFASRVSMCALVVMMLEWERDQEEDEEIDCFTGVPTESESCWSRVGSLLTISAAIQMPTHHPPT